MIKFENNMSAKSWPKKNQIRFDWEKKQIRILIFATLDRVNQTGAPLTGCPSNEVLGKHKKSRNDGMILPYPVYFQTISPNVYKGLDYYSKSAAKIKM